MFSGINTTPSAPTFPKKNNLEWLRLIFAIQVVLEHAGEHLGLAIPGFVGHFPGVPAFFFVSGFLIYASYMNAPGRRYLENRFLRLFPALVFVTIGGAAVALATHGVQDLRENLPTYVVWFVAQTTLGQAYNPALFRDVGVGVINGSLWTITTEVLFYAAVPGIVWLERRFRFTLLLIVALSFAIYVYGPVLGDKTVYRNRTLYDVIALTPLAWGWMFAIGILAMKNFDRLRKWIRYAPVLILPMLLMMVWGEGPIFGSAGNRLGLIYFSAYICIVLWLAFGTPYRPLAFDFSYGCYVWHMPIINLLLIMAMPSTLIALPLTIAIAALSWFMVEKPALKLKRRSLKSVRNDVAVESR